jgi:oligo-1,6-glucosidase
MDPNDAPWWTRATAYQIYPRSFCDSNGDGIGDLPGIISRLDYLEGLGIGFIWLSPVYASPMVDMGYDISDYRAIARDFGTLDDMDLLIAEARNRGIGIVMDLVVNHTSDRHAWFQDALTGRQARHRDYYIWRDPAPDGGPPDDLQSSFGGPAWTRDPASGQYYLHLFDPRQPDLNWQNPRMRTDIHDMMNWWLDRGIAGFRMDVIDLIGKDVDRGVTVNGPHLHDHIREMIEATAQGREVVTVGEAWSATPETALLYCGRARGELSMVFHFANVTLFWGTSRGKWAPEPFELVALKTVFDRWQAALSEDGWNSLFWSNHDLPRAVSAYGDTGEWRVRSAKMLATVLHLMKGTPYIYQGEELGMTNAGFTRIDQYRDVETLNQHEIMRAEGMSEAAFLQGARASSRDNARTPMHWTAGLEAGFTSGTPWIEVNPNHTEINAAAQVDDPRSVLSHYRTLIRLRREHDLIVFGSYTPIAPDHPKVLAYRRDFRDRSLTVIANWTREFVEFDLPPGTEVEGRCLISNCGPRHGVAGRLTLEPYEAFVILRGATGTATIAAS